MRIVCWVLQWVSGHKMFMPACAAWLPHQHVLTHRVECTRRQLDARLASVEAVAECIQS